MPAGRCSETRGRWAGGRSLACSALISELMKFTLLLFSGNNSIGLSDVFSDWAMTPITRITTAAGSAAAAFQVLLLRTMDISKQSRMTDEFLEPVVTGCLVYVSLPLLVSEGPKPTAVSAMHAPGRGSEFFRLELARIFCSLRHELIRINYATRCVRDILRQTKRQTQGQAAIPVRFSQFCLVIFIVKHT